MKQSRTMSLIEAIANVLVGYGIAVATQIAIFPIFGLQVTVAQNLQIGAAFTVVSIARSYTLRRLFEAIRTGARKPPLMSSDGSPPDHLPYRRGFDGPAGRRQSSMR